MNYWPLIGVAAVVLGFVLRLNPALVVVAAGFITGLVAQLSPLDVLEVLGKAYTEKRFLLLFLLTLPVIGLLERHGLKEHAQNWVARLRGATMGRLLIAYLLMRQFASALGLTSLGGHPQTVRPLLAPMAEGAAQTAHGELSDEDRQRIRAMAAGTDNVGLFFGEDVFIAFGAVLLMQSFLAENGLVLDPLHIALWGIPTAICAFVIHSLRILSFERTLTRRLLQARSAAAQGDGPAPSTGSSE